MTHQISPMSHGRKLSDWSFFSIALRPRGARSWSIRPMFRSASIIFALALTATGTFGNPVAAHDAHISSIRPGADILPAKESAAFAIAAERAQLEPSYRKRPLGLDANSDTAYPHFYYWTVIPSWGQGVVYFYVDRRTGTVWGGYSNCTPIHSPELAALQARFRRRFHIPLSKVRQIDKEGSPQEECRP